MLGRIVLTVALLAGFATAALAAPITGKVIKVQDKQVRVVLSVKPAVWMKKGAFVRFLGGRSTLTAVGGDTLTITTPNAAKTKVGESVTVEKPRASAAGC